MRATSDRVREALFNVLEAQDMDFTRVLDAYAGSGALGIEALSRGATACDFVERDAGSAAVIRENVRATGYADAAHVHQMPVERAPDRLRGPYTLVLADPPYADDAAVATIDRLAGSSLVDSASTIVLEHSGRRDAPGHLGPFPLVWSRRYGDSQLSIYRRQAQEEEPA